MRKEREKLFTRRGQTPLTKDVVFKNKQIRVYSVGFLCYLTGLARVTIRLWEKKEILPLPILKLVGQWRWYTPLELMEYTNLIRAHYQSSRNLMILRGKLHTARIKIKRLYDSVDQDSMPDDYAKLSNEDQIFKNIYSVVFQATENERWKSVNEE
jgi:DNA-binding transcriptional MerR regulator